LAAATDVGSGVLKLGCVAYSAIRPNRNALLAEPVFLPRAMLDDLQRRRIRPRRRMFRGSAQRRQTNFFDLDRDHVRTSRQMNSRIDIIEGSRKAAINDEARRARRVRVKHLNAVAQ